MKKTSLLLVGASVFLTSCGELPKRMVNPVETDDVKTVDVIRGVTVVSPETLTELVTVSEVSLADNDLETFVEWTDLNAVNKVVLDLGKTYRIEGVIITNGPGGNKCWVSEITVGNGSALSRPQLHRLVNLNMAPGAHTKLTIGPAVGRYISLDFLGTGIAEIEVLGKVNVPERHLSCWMTDIERDFLNKMDYLSEELSVTDVWLDYIETAWPQKNDNLGFEPWEKSGVFEEFARRGIRYWLGEHEYFTCLVDSAEVLEDDETWARCIIQAKQIYSRARDLGFTGLVWDGEPYVNEMAWRYRQHWGPNGLYYRRGLQYGKVIKDIWDCEIIQMFEARIYGNFQLVGGAQYVTEEMPEDYQQGNYWFLKGIHDAGIRVSMALEKTYGAGHSEMSPSIDGLDHLSQWFEHMPDFYVNITFEAYPFLHRVLPGFHPWNCRTRLANYLPKYLDEQLACAQQITDSYWIYTEGLRFGGDPRQTLNLEALKKYGIDAQEYIDIFKSYKTERSLR